MFFSVPTPIGLGCLGFNIEDLPSSKLTLQWKMDPAFEDTFPIKNGDIPASYVGYVSLPE